MIGKRKKKRDEIKKNLREKLDYKMKSENFFSLFYCSGAISISKPSKSSVIGIWQPNLELSFTW